MEIEIQSSVLEKEPDIPNSEMTLQRKKAKAVPGKKEEGSLFNRLWQTGFHALKNLAVLEEQAEQKLEKYKVEFQRWLGRTALRVLSLFMSLVFLVLGLIFIAIDYGHVPRGIVFVCGGLLGFLVLRLTVPNRESIRRIR